MNITGIVNAAIWSGEDFVTRWDGKGWCDIIIKLQVGANVGLSCAVTNIVYNLHAILKADSVLPEFNSWVRITKDLAISLGTPILVMALSYLIQVFRYGIARYNGCQNLLSPTWVTTVLYTMWMLIWSFIGAVYALLVLLVFFKKRKDVRDILHCTNSGLNLTRFARLLIFCFIIVLVMFPFSLYSFIQDLEQVGGSYNFKSTHSKALWNVIIKFDPGKPVYNIWLYILMSYLVFLIFGLGTDALSMYGRFLRRIGLGFIIDSIHIFIQRNRENRVGQLLGKMSAGTEFQNLGSSDEYGDKTTMFSDTDATSPSSQQHFIVDYRLPNERRNRSRRKRNDIDSFLDLENNFPSNDNVEIADSRYVPFLSNSYDDEDEQISLDGFSKISIGPSDKKNTTTFETYSPMSTLENGSSEQKGSSTLDELSKVDSQETELEFHFKVMKKEESD